MSDRPEAGGDAGAGSDAGARAGAEASGADAGAGSGRPPADPAGRHRNPGKPSRRGATRAGQSAAQRARQPVDPDVDLHVPAQRAEIAGRRLWTVLAAIAAGGAVGACARYAAASAWPTPGDAFPWAVFLVNVVGCGLTGVLMVLLKERPGAGAHPLLRPFLGTGMLGGFTTFSTYVVDVRGLLTGGESATAAAYAVGTLAVALGAVWAAAALTRGALRTGAGTAGGG